MTVLKFLLEKRTEGCSKKRMDHAAATGLLNDVKFLHESRSEGCTTHAIDKAALNFFWKS